MSVPGHKWTARGDNGERAGGVAGRIGFRPPSMHAERRAST